MLYRRCIKDSDIYHTVEPLNRLARIRDHSSARSIETDTLGRIILVEELSKNVLPLYRLVHWKCIATIMVGALEMYCHYIGWCIGNVLPLYRLVHWKVSFIQVSPIQSVLYWRFCRICPPFHYMLTCMYK